MDKTAEQIAAGFGQDVDLAETGQPMFITIAGREIVVMDAEPFKVMQSKAAELDCQPAVGEDVVERVAKALFEHDEQWMFGSFPEITRAWGELPASCQDDWRNKARAAIAAIAAMGGEGK
ncbi:hypothetical protein C7451_106166 [Blastomonas natatoria]|uniref:Uncharacterized protein n=1 Tax=Blastomonas natatoria TaxID=34015 RepID=A0A2V3V2J8_9SPHN|nr:hypothetical protein [Blastomonas natatoria]PXW76002.1 hypothetical protein C7451_106166 [Blastomonas natatoria]